MKDKFILALFYIGITLIIIIALSLIGLEIYVIVKYNNTPISEVPTWVIWLLWFRNS